MLQFQEVFDPSKDEANILTRCRKSDTPAETGSVLELCQDVLDDLYEKKEVVTQFLAAMNEQSETFSAVAFSNAFLQLASRIPELYEEIISATKFLALTYNKDMTEVIRAKLSEFARDVVANVPHEDTCDCTCDCGCDHCQDKEASDTEDDPAEK